MPLVILIILVGAQMAWRPSKEEDNLKKKWGEENEDMRKEKGGGIKMKKHY